MTAQQYFLSDVKCAAPAGGVLKQKLLSTSPSHGWRFQIKWTRGPGRSLLLSHAADLFNVLLIRFFRGKPGSQCIFNTSIFINVSKTRSTNLLLHIGYSSSQCNSQLALLHWELLFLARVSATHVCFHFAFYCYD